MAPLETYLAHAEQLAQEVVNAWGTNVEPGNASFLADDFMDLFHKACDYRDAKEIAQNHREFHVLTEKEEEAEKASLNLFAETYKAYWEKRQAA
jgi:hypothetical protein